MTSPVPSHPAITTPYRKPGSWSIGYHTGVDLGSAGINGARVVSTTAGRVVGTGTAWGRAYGDRQVIIQAADGTQHGYMHMQTATVRRGQTVAAGQQIGTVGTRGNSTGPHLHYEVRRSPYRYGDDTNPAPYMHGTTPPPPEDDDMTPEQAKTLDQIANRVGVIEKRTDYLANKAGLGTATGRIANINNRYMPEMLTLLRAIADKIGAR